MKNRLTLLLCALSTTASAFVPFDDRYPAGGNPPQPSALPVHGPIRPSSVRVNSAAADPEAQIRLPNPAGPLETKAVFWGPKWASQRYSSEKIAGMDQWYEGFKGSSYSHILNEYLTPSRPVTYSGHVVDENPPPFSWVSTGNTWSDAAVSEICTLMGSNQLPYRSSNNISHYNFPIYLDRKRHIGEPCAIKGFDVCTVGKHTVWFAYSVTFDLDHDEACGVKDDVTGHSPGLSALANTTSRITADVVTNWDNFGYYDESGNEIDDKCLGVFSVPFVTFTNGSIWKLQDLWSNAAYEASAGYPNAAGEKGCVDGR